MSRFYVHHQSLSQSDRVRCDDACVPEKPHPLMWKDHISVRGVKKPVKLTFKFTCTLL